MKKFLIISDNLLEKEMSIIIIFYFEILTQIVGWRKMISLKYTKKIQGDIPQYQMYNVFLKV